MALGLAISTLLQYPPHVYVTYFFMQIFHGYSTETKVFRQTDEGCCLCHQPELPRPTQTNNFATHTDIRWRQLVACDYHIDRLAVLSLTFCINLHS